MDNKIKKEEEEKIKKEKEEKIKKEKEKKKEKREILRRINKILELAPDGGYVYRGQSDAAYSVTSTLYRTMGDHYPEGKEEWGKMEHDMNLVQEEALGAARKFANEDYDDEEMLSRIQHYSGDTNLIDFTRDYFVALFFACYHKYGEKDGKGGKVFLLKTSKLQDKEIEMITPAHPPNRVTAQKSVFIQSPTGIIPDDMMDFVEISLDLKQPILDYLKEHHDISLPTIYNDLHGYIRNSKEHDNAIMEFYLGLNCVNKRDNEQSPEDKKDAAKKAMEHLEKAIQLDPKYVRAYNGLGVVKKILGDLSGAKSDYEDARKHCEYAIDLDPKYATAYINRGNIKRKLSGNVLDAIRDFDKAIEMDPKHVSAYNHRGLAKVDCGDAKRKLDDESGAIIDYKDAIRDFDKAIEVNPKHVGSYNNRGLAKAHCGGAKRKLGDEPGAIIDYKDAIRDYGKAIEVDPKYAIAYNSRGFAKNHCGNGKRKLGDESGAITDYRDAIRDYDKAIELDPKYVQAYDNRGIAKINCGDGMRKLGGESGAITDYRDAISDYDKIIEMDAEYMNAYYNRGLAKERLGGRENLQQALSDFQEAGKLTLQQKKKDMVGKVQASIERVTARIAEMD